MSHPTADLNDVVHQRHRLAILTVAAEADRVEFTHLKTALELTGGNLNRHLAVLEHAGYVTLNKTTTTRRQKTWVRLTRAGKLALAHEIDSLAALVRRHQKGVDSSTVSAPPPPPADEDPYDEAGHRTAQLSERFSPPT